MLNFGRNRVLTISKYVFFAARLAGDDDLAWFLKFRLKIVDFSQIFDFWMFGDPSVPSVRRSAARPKASEYHAVGAERIRRSSMVIKACEVKWESVGSPPVAVWHHLSLLGWCWDRFKIVLGSFGDHFVISLGSLCDHLGIVFWSFWDSFGIGLG